VEDAPFPQLGSVAGGEGAGLAPCLRQARAFAARHAAELWEGDVLLRLPRSSLVLLYSDVADSTGLNLQLGDCAYYELVQEHDHLVRGCLARHGGTEFKHHGDGVAAWFADAGDAVRCGLDMHRAVASLAGAWLHRPLRLRVGIAAGPVTVSAHDVHGLTVVRAVRISALADPGDLFVSDEVASAAAPLDPEVRFEPLGLRRLKGFPAPEPLFRARGPRSG
jgi:class 3 adenylate cyclase